MVAGKTAYLNEGDLEVVANPRIAVLSKGDAARPRPIALGTTLPRNWWEIRLAFGSSTGPGRTWGASLYDASAMPNAPLAREWSGDGAFTYGITDRLTWALPLPAFAYRFGEPGGIELVPRFGLTSFGHSDGAGWLGSLGLGAAARVPTTDQQSLLIVTSASSDFATRSRINYQPTGAPTVWRLQAGLAYTWTLRDTVTLGLGAHVAGPLRLGRAAAPSDPQMSKMLIFGSLDDIGFRHVPLISVHLSERFSLDGYASWAVDLGASAVHVRYLAGFTWNL